MLRRLHGFLVSITCIKVMLFFPAKQGSLPLNISDKIKIQYCIDNSKDINYMTRVTLYYYLLDLVNLKNINFSLRFFD
jgi:hypothetical protein